jgi:hypothetical protein
MHTTQRLQESTVFIATTMIQTHQVVTSNAVVSKQILADTGLLVQKGTEMQEMMKTLQSWAATALKYYPALDIWKPQVKPYLVNGQLPYPAPYIF